MSRALILVYLTAIFVIGVILTIGAVYAFEFFVRAATEEPWQKAMRIRAMLDAWRWWGAPIDPIRMTYDNMHIIDVMTFSFIALRTVMPVVLIWRVLVGAARRMETDNHPGFRDAPFTAIFNEYRYWWRDTGVVWSLRWRYLKHLMQRIRQYVRGAGFAAIAVVGAGIYAGISWLAALAIGALAYIVLVIALPWVLRHVFGEKLAPFPSFANRHAVENVLDPPVSETLPYAPGVVAEQDNTVGVFDRYTTGQTKHHEAIESAYRNSLRLAHPMEKDLPQPIDVGRLSPEGRLLYLPIVINADNAKGVFDRLDFKLSDHAAGRYVYRAERRGIDLTRWRDAHATIEAYLGGRWRIDPRDGATLTMTRLPDIPASFQLPDDALRDGDIYFGVDLNTGDPVHVPINKLSHTLVTGPSGKGKSVFLHQVMASVMHNIDRFEAVHLVDLKFGLELQRYADVSDKFHLTRYGTDLPGVLNGLLEELQRRGDDMAARKITEWDGGLIFVVIDEFAEVGLSADDAKAKAAMLNKVKRLLNLSRAVGFRFWVQSQAFTVDSIPGDIRKNLNSIISFQLESNQVASQLFGGIETFPADIRTLREGQVIYRDGRTSQMRAVQGAHATHKALRRYAH